MRLPRMITATEFRVPAAIGTYYNDLSYIVYDDIIVALFTECDAIPTVGNAVDQDDRVLIDAAAAVGTQLLRSCVPTACEVLLIAGPCVIPILRIYDQPR